MPKPKTSFPTDAELSAAAGIPLPSDFIQLLRLAVERRARGFSHLTDDSLGILLAGPWEAAFTRKPPASHDIRYTQTPPELVPFATQNVDGVHYGFIARTPELPADDYPAGEFCPMDSDPVVFLGNTFSQAIENLASQHLSSVKDDDEQLSKSAVAELAEISKRLKITPSIRKAGRQFTRDGGARPIPIPKLRGHDFQPTLDGIGVLAPKSAFANKAPSHDPEDLAAGLKQAAGLMISSYPASALVILKDLWWCHWHDRKVIPRLAPLLASAYRALNRHTFADVIQQKAQRAGTR